MLQFAVDTGGTFTDLVVDGNGLQPRFYKRSTTPADPIEGLLAVFAAAAADHGDDLSTFIGRGDSLVFGTTRATNAVVTGSTARTALLCTEGHPDVLLFREGGGRTTLFDYTQEYPAPYIPRRSPSRSPNGSSPTARCTQSSTKTQSARWPNDCARSRWRRSRSAFSGRS